MGFRSIQRVLTKFLKAEDLGIPLHNRYRWKVVISEPMKQPKLSTFRRMRTLEEAQALADDLDRLGFKAELAQDATPASEAIMGSGVSVFRVKIDRSDFVQAEEALEKDIEHDKEIPADHYLLDFTDQELVDVVLKEDEWSTYDRHLARVILADKGKPISKELIASIRQQRIDDLRQPAPAQTGFIVLGYLSNVLGGLLGVAIGYHLNTSKKTLPNGDQVYAFQEKDRRHGKRMFFLGLAIFIPLVIIRIVWWIMKN